MQEKSYLYLLTCDVEKMNIIKKKLTYLSLTSLKNEKKHLHQMNIN